MAVGVGAATITATGDAAQTATLTVQTVPLYQGNWAGTATVLVMHRPGRIHSRRGTAPRIWGDPASNA
jgi:hypothetical protein